MYFRDGDLRRVAHDGPLSIETLAECVSASTWHTSRSLETESGLVLARCVGSVDDKRWELTDEASPMIDAARTPPERGRRA